MNITDPYPRSKFAIDGEDVVVSELEESIEFALLLNGSVLLKETYNYDTDGRVTIRGVADLVSKALYGTLETGVQRHAYGEVEFYIGSVAQYQKTLYASRMKNPRDPDGAKNVLTAAERTVCHPGHPFYVSVVGGADITLYNAAGAELASARIGSGADGGAAVSTHDCDPAALFENTWRRGAWMIVGDELRADLLHEPCDGAVDVRFLNRYDVMESLTAAVMTEKPSAKDEVSLMNSRRTRFSVESATEYTLQSGMLRHKDQYETWQDLLTARRAQIRQYGTWHDIIVTKANYTRHRRDFYGSQAEVAFQTANPYLCL